MNEQASVETFNPEDFRKVGAVAQFLPEYLTPKFRVLEGKPVRVAKVNPKTIVVETKAGDRITTDAWMLVPTDKPFQKSVKPPLQAGNFARIVQPLRLTGETSEGLWIILDNPKVDGKVRVTRPGGTERGSYYTLPSSAFEVVPASEVLA